MANLDQIMDYIADSGDYSSEPVQVGRFYKDGAWVPFYRKVYTGNTPSTSGGTVFTDQYVMNRFIYMTGYVLNTGNSRIQIPGYNVSNTDRMTWYPQGDDMKMVMGNTSVLGNRPYVCIVYYAE